MEVQDSLPLLLSLNHDSCVIADLVGRACPDHPISLFLGFKQKSVEGGKKQARLGVGVFMEGSRGLPFQLGGMKLLKAAKLEGLLVCKLSLSELKRALLHCRRAIDRHTNLSSKAFSCLGVISMDFGKIQKI